MIKLLYKDMISSNQLFSEAYQALDAGRGYAIVRIGDGENAVLDGHPTSEGYCGIASPNPKAQIDMVKAIKAADAIGVFPEDSWTESIFSRHNIKPRKIFYAFDNLMWGAEPGFIRLLKKYPILLVGRPMPVFADFLRKEINAHVVDVVIITSYEQIPAIITQVGRQDFKVALLSAGANAVILAPKLAKEHACVAVDFGHATDHILLGERPFIKD